MLDHLPALVAAVCLSIYWFWVVVKLIQVGLKIGKDPNAFPREFIGQLMRVLWYPCVGALLIGLWVAGVPALARAGQKYGAILFEGYWPVGMLWWCAAIPATVVCAACTLFTFVCWRKMGRSWRIGIDPSEKLELVSTGPYRYVRHPIYALRMVIDLCVIVMAPTLLVLVTAAIDFVLMQIEARREERYMQSQHGPEYERYKNSVGRFVPRPSVV